jgi:hypothetical protein
LTVTGTEALWAPAVPVTVTVQLSLGAALLAETVNVVPLIDAVTSVQLAVAKESLSVTAPV